MKTHENVRKSMWQVSYQSSNNGRLTVRRAMKSFLGGQWRRSVIPGLFSSLEPREVLIRIVLLVVYKSSLFYPRP